MTHSIWTTRNIYFSTHWNSLRECKYISQNPGFVHNLFVWISVSKYISFHDIMEQETHDIVLCPLVVSGNCYMLPCFVQLLTLDTCDWCWFGRLDYLHLTFNSFAIFQLISIYWPAPIISHLTDSVQMLKRLNSCTENPPVLSLSGNVLKLCPLQCWSTQRSQKNVPLLCAPMIIADVPFRLKYCKRVPAHCSRPDLL